MSEPKDAHEAAELLFASLIELDSKPAISSGKWNYCFVCHKVAHHSLAEQQNHGLRFVSAYVCDTCENVGMYS